MYDAIVREALGTAAAFPVGDDPLGGAELEDLLAVAQSAAECIASGYVEREGDAEAGRAAFDRDRTGVAQQLGAALSLIARARRGMPPPEEIAA